MLLCYCRRDAAATSSYGDCWDVETKEEYKRGLLAIAVGVLPNPPRCARALPPICCCFDGGSRLGPPECRLGVGIMGVGVVVVLVVSRPRCARVGHQVVVVYAQ